MHEAHLVYVSTAEADKCSKRELKDVNAKAADPEQSTVRAAAGKGKAGKEPNKVCTSISEAFGERNTRHRSQC